MTPEPRPRGPVDWARQQAAEREQQAATDPSWSVQCRPPGCGARPGERCRRWDGNEANVSCKERWREYDRVQAAERDTTARVFAALHRSAEQDVTRVIELYERWVKAGPPPLGVPIARWWDARLVELHDAIRPPESAAQPEEK
ncbi:hypothetical protein [Streptomyces luteogriseus]|uniref:hypothetical protein n=1 Tax=Streptomyces luteogriseus TaxID=68233 RepID=UPI00380F17A1